MLAEREEDYPLLPTENISHTTFTTLPTTPTTPTCSLSSLTKRERENLERFRAQVARLSLQNTDLPSKLARANERNSELQRLLAELRASHLHANSLCVVSCKQLNTHFNITKFLLWRCEMLRSCLRGQRKQQASSKTGHCQRALQEHWQAEGFPDLEEEAPEPAS